MGDVGPILQLLLSALLVQIPVLLAILVGVILAFVFWRRNAKVSLLVIAALALTFVVRVGSVLQSVMVPYLVSVQMWEIQQIRSLTSCLGIVWSLLSAVALGLLLAAAFGWRKGGDAEAGGSGPESPA